MAKPEPQVIDTPKAEPKLMEALPEGGSSLHFWPEEYRPPDPTKIINAQEGWRYRLLSKARVAREGGNTRDWEIVQGNDPENSQDPEARRLIGTGAPYGVHASDTTRHVGDLVLGRMPEKYAQSKERYLKEKNSEQVNGALGIGDEKDKKAFTEAILRKAGVEPSLVRRFIDNGGAMVMNPQEP